MGQEISSTNFQAEDFERYRAHLGAEVEAAAALFAGGGFAGDGRHAGFELEAWLLDHNFFPAPCNQPFLARLASPLVVPELSLFNIELNGTPQALRGTALSQLHAELHTTWQACMAAAHEEEATVVAIGTLPTLREADLNLRSMTPALRYRALNREVLRARGGRPLSLDIDGIESLHTTHADVMLEAATTSFQVHLQVPARQVPRYLNASMLLSGPLVALAANSPFLFGRALWHETRIPLFEQSVSCDTGGHPEGRRVGFGPAYLGPDPTDYFRDNAARYPVLLPLCSTAPPGHFEHLRLHNGTVWRWNRLLIGFDAAQQPHLRIEQRVMPAGPSTIDMMANAAFYYGAVHMLATRPLAPEQSLPFAQTRANFYTAARHGLQAQQTWPGAGTLTAADLLQQLLPLAREGLNRLEVAAADIERYMDVIAVRLRTGRNGAAWQLAHHARHRDPFRLTADYLAHQRSGLPVHEWPL